MADWLTGNIRLTTFHSSLVDASSMVSMETLFGNKAEFVEERPLEHEKTEALSLGPGQLHRSCSSNRVDIVWTVDDSLSPDKQTLGKPEAVFNQLEKNFFAWVESRKDIVRFGFGGAFTKLESDEGRAIQYIAQQIKFLQPPAELGDLTIQYNVPFEATFEGESFRLNRFLKWSCLRRFRQQFMPTQSGIFQSTPEVQILGPHCVTDINSAVGQPQPFSADKLRQLISVAKRESIAAIGD